MEPVRYWTLKTNQCFRHKGKFYQVRSPFIARDYRGRDVWFCPWTKVFIFIVA